MFAIFMMISFCMDFYYGGMMVLGYIAIPSAHTTIGVYCGVLLLFGGMIGLTLFYGLWNLKNWARLILQIGFPAQVIFNIIIDSMSLDNYFLLAVSIIVATYLQLPNRREQFS